MQQGLWFKILDVIHMNYPSQRDKANRHVLQPAPAPLLNVMYFIIPAMRLHIQLFNETDT